MDASNMRSFGNKVKASLRSRSITLQTFASFVPLDYSTLSKFLNGKYDTPEAHTHIQNIIKALASKEVIKNRGQAEELLDMANCPYFSESDWYEKPLNKLKASPLKEQEIASVKQGNESQMKEHPAFPSTIYIHTEHTAVNTNYLTTTTENFPPEEQPFISMVDNRSNDFVPRPQEYAAIKHSLLSKKRNKLTAITTALYGAGGYGKTTLALALCHDEDIIAAFPKGILWITLGTKPENLIGKIEDLIYLLSKERPGFTSLEAATTYLKKLLEEASFLIVVDDVWNFAHLKPFLQGGPYCSRLITTRIENILPANTQCFRVDAMRQDEAIQLICSGMAIDGLIDDKKKLYSLVKRLGRWPLLLTLANGILRERINRYNQEALDALNYLQRALDKRGVVAFDEKNAQERKQAVANTLEISFALLDEDDLVRYQKLVIFPEDVTIPLVTLRHLWRDTKNFDELEVEDLCRRLYNLSLLLLFDMKKQEILLHDVIRNYLQIKLSDEICNIHQKFLESFNIKRWKDLSFKETYLWRYLITHLLSAGWREIGVETVKDLQYIAKKAFLCGMSFVETDLKIIEECNQDDIILIELRRQIIRIGHLINNCDTLHEVQCILFNRLSHIRELTDLCLTFEQEIALPLIKVWHPLPDLSSSALIRTFSDHLDSVWGCKVSPQGDWIVSASADATLKIWDVQTGEVQRTLEGHTGRVRDCAVSPQGDWIVSASASEDKTLKIWDVQTGEVRHTLRGHKRAVLGCAIGPQGDWIVSASEDKTLKIWDVQTGEVQRTLEGHTGRIWDCAVSPQGDWIVSASDDKTLKIWDVQTGEVRHTLRGHKDGVRGCAIGPQGDWTVSTSYDNTIKIWKLDSTEEPSTLRGHTMWIQNCAVSPQGDWIVSASGDDTLRIWKTKTVTNYLALNLQEDYVHEYAISPQSNWLVTRSQGTILKIWDIHAGEIRKKLRGHKYFVYDYAISPQGDWIVSASEDKTLKIWDVQTGEVRHTLPGNNKGLWRCAISPQGDWIASPSFDDGTITIWDVRTGEKRQILRGHKGGVLNCAVSPQGDWVISVSNDNTLKVWDINSGQCLTTFYAEGTLAICAIHPDNQHLIVGGAGGLYFLHFVR